MNLPLDFHPDVEAEVRAGGRYPLWFRAVRVLLVLALIALCVLMIWRRFG